MSKCPCCGGPAPKVEKPMVCLNSNTISARGKVIRVSGREAEVASLLVDAMPLPMQSESIIERVYGGQPADDAYHCVKTYVRRLKTKLAPLGLRINSFYGRGHTFRGHSMGWDA